MMLISSTDSVPPIVHQRYFRSLCGFWWLCAVRCAFVDYGVIPSPTLFSVRSGISLFSAAVLCHLFLTMHQRVTEESFSAKTLCERKFCLSTGLLSLRGFTAVVRYAAHRRRPPRILVLRSSWKSPHRPHRLITSIRFLVVIAIPSCHS